MTECQGGKLRRNSQFEVKKMTVMGNTEFQVPVGYLGADIHRHLEIWVWSLGER